MARVQIPPKPWDFFSLICFALFFVMASCRKTHLHIYISTFVNTFIYSIFIIHTYTKTQTHTHACKHTYIHTYTCYRGWSGGTMVLGKLPVPRRPTYMYYSRARAYCTCSRCGWGGLDIFSLIYHFSFFSFSLCLGDGPI